MTLPRIVRLYDSALPSGNGYKVRLLAALLNVALEVRLVDPFATPPETRSEDFLRMNPNGKLPVVELSDGTFLSESGAILYYLASGTPFLPEELPARARVLQWMFFEQYSHEPYIAVLKYWSVWGGLEHVAPADLEKWRTRGQEALSVMEVRLREAPFLVGETYTIADVALYAYTHTAAATGYDVESLPALRGWIARVAEHPRHIPIWGGPGALTAGDGR